MALDYTITHNDSTWTSSVSLDTINLSNGAITDSITSAGTRTLNCAGKYMPNNLVIGDKTLNCAGKIMTGNVTIAAQTSGPSIKINGKSYRVDSGMTWSAWLSSAYNTDGFKAELGPTGDFSCVKTADSQRCVYAYDGILPVNSATYVTPEKTITVGYEYLLTYKVTITYKNQDYSWGSGYILYSTMYYSTYTTMPGEKQTVTGTAEVDYPVGGRYTASISIFNKSNASYTFTLNGTTVASGTLTTASLDTRSASYVIPESYLKPGYQISNTGSANSSSITCNITITYS